MKLQLDKKNLTCMVLSLSELVTAVDAQVLRVGFRKLLGTARTTFIIDVSRAAIEPAAEHLILETQIDALANKIRLVIIGLNPRVCQAANLKAAQALMVSVVQLDRVLVPQLQSLYKLLNTRREAANAQLESPLPANQPVFVTAENARLLTEVEGLENEVEALLKVHVVPEPDPLLEAERAEFERRLNANLSARRIGLQSLEARPSKVEADSPVLASISETSFAWIASKAGVKELAQGELKVELQAIEIEVVGLEKKVRRFLTLKAENQEFRLRLKKLQRVLYALLYYAVHPSEQSTVRKKLQVLSADFEELSNLTAVKTVPPASQ